jgi:tRNA nucleotidyltransferase/poly(A) polymerase
MQRSLCAAQLLMFLFLSLDKYCLQSFRYFHTKIINKKSVHSHKSSILLSNRCKGLILSENAVKMNVIKLNEKEVKLFNILKHVVSELNTNTTVRVAGGWVRDKILYGKTKDDVDIVLDNMTGEQFCNKLNEWRSLKGDRTYSIGVIQSNPDKSKHLETATTKIESLLVDFVNLRSETYTEHSRIPEMRIGTPLEDALRRDLTVNSLFYNIHTDSIEDFTGMGLSDMRDQVLRTPLEPHTTLLDDPLRLMRVLRFALRLNFSIAPDLISFMASSDVHIALQQKVSRERILSELEGLLTLGTQETCRGIYLLNRLGIMPYIIYTSHHDDGFPPVTITPLTGSNIEFENSFRAIGSATLIVSEYLQAMLNESVTSYATHNAHFPRLSSMISSFDESIESINSDRFTRR